MSENGKNFGGEHEKPMNNPNRFPSNGQTIEYDHIHAY